MAGQGGEGLDTGTLCKLFSNLGTKSTPMMGRYALYGGEALVPGTGQKRWLREEQGIEAKLATAFIPQFRKRKKKKGNSLFLIELPQSDSSSTIPGVIFLVVLFPCTPPSICCLKSTIKTSWAFLSPHKRRDGSVTDKDRKKIYIHSLALLKNPNILLGKKSLHLSVSQVPISKAKSEYPPCPKHWEEKKCKFDV